MAVVNVTFPGNLAQTRTAAELRALPSTYIQDGYFSVVTGLRSIFEFDAGSIAGDDGSNVLKPDDRTPLQLGRWLLVLGGIGTPPTPSFNMGLLGSLATLTVPIGIDRVTTSGFERLGWGSASYVRDTDQADGSGPQPWRRKDAGGVWFKLDASNGVPAAALGFDPAKTATANAIALTSAWAAAATLGAKRIVLGCGLFPLSGFVVPPEADSQWIDGRGAFLTTTANAPIITLDGIDVTIQGAIFVGDSPAASGTLGVSTKPLQVGIKALSPGYANLIDCHFRNLSTGFHAANTKQGFPLTGFFQQPSTIRGGTARGCFYGLYFADGAAANTYGEYWRVSGMKVTDSTYVGLKCLAGNCSFVDNSFMGNKGGVWLSSSKGQAGSNSDHGIFSNNTVNHNLCFNLVVENPLRGWLITGNELWAALGGAPGSGTAKMTDVTGFTGVPAFLDKAVGVVFWNCENITFTNNDVRHNQINRITRFTGTGNVFTGNRYECAPDGTYTLVNTYDLSQFFYSRGDCLGPEIYKGTWVDTTNAPHNGNFNRWIDVQPAGTSGAPVYANGWVHFGANSPTFAFRKNPDGGAEWKGKIKSGTVGSPAATLPAYYINMFPQNGTREVPVSSSAVVGSVMIDGPAQTLTPMAPCVNTYVSFDGVRYWVEPA